MAIELGQFLETWTILFSVQYHRSLSILEVLKVFLRQFLYSGIGYSKIVRPPGRMISTSPVNQPWDWWSLFASIRLAWLPNPPFFTLTRIDHDYRPTWSQRETSKLFWFQDVHQWFSQARHFHTDSSVRFVHGTLNSSPLGIILKDFLRTDHQKLHDPHWELWRFEIMFVSS